MAGVGSLDPTQDEEDADEWVPRPTHLRNSRRAHSSQSANPGQSASAHRPEGDKMRLLQRGVWAALEGMQDDPDASWEVLRQTQVVRRRPPTNPSAERPPGHTRFVCMSDSHNLHGQVEVPHGDVFIHAGDFTMTGLPEEVREFNAFLGRLPHKDKIVIAGNHELSFDRDSYASTWERFGHPEQFDCGAVRASLTNCTYLEDAETVVRGHRIYGSPWQPEFCGWAFNLPRGKPLAKRWGKIPSGVDVLVTHGPPLGHGDRIRSKSRVGCVELLRAVQTVRPAYHVFGHVHEDYGVTEDGFGTVYVNASTCTHSYSPTNPCIVFDLPDKS